MSEELLKEPDGIAAGLESPAAIPHQTSSGVIREVELLREQVQQLCTAVRGLVQLQSIANQKLDAAIKGNADCAVL